MKKRFLFLLFTFIFLVFQSPIHAQEEPVSAPVDGHRASKDFISQSIRKIGRNILVENEEVDGDAYLVGLNITVNEDIDDNAFLIGKNIKINNRIKNSIFIIGWEVYVNEDVKNNAFIIAKDVHLNADIGEDLNVKANRVLLKGDVGDDARIKADEVYVDENSRLKEETFIESGVLKIKQGYDYRGELFVYNGKKYEILTDFESEEIPVDLSTLKFMRSPIDKFKPFLSIYGIFFIFAFIFGLSLLTVIINKLFPVKTEKLIENLDLSTKNIFSNFKTSLGMLVFGGVLTFILSVSVIGWPILYFLIIIFLLTNMIGKLFVNYKIGQLLIEKIQPNIKNVYLRALVGHLVVIVLFLLISTIPYIGNFLVILIGLTLFLWGFGATVRVKLKNMKDAK